MGHEYDITDSSSFSGAMESFDLACKELKKIGKAVVKNHEVIEDEGNYTITSGRVIRYHRRLAARVISHFSSPRKDKTDITLHLGK